MSGKFTIQVFSKLTESKIGGVAAFPRLSRNGRFYPPSALAKLSGMTVPMLWAHNGTPEEKFDQIPADKIIGEATVHWDSEMQQLKYEGKVKEEYSDFVKKYADQLQVSIGAHYTARRMCTGLECFEAATDLHFEEISLTPAAGMPETNVKLIESSPEECMRCAVIHGLDPVSQMKYEQFHKATESVEPMVVEWKKAMEYNEKHDEQGRFTAADEAAVEEAHMHSQNDEQLYKSTHEPWVKNVVRKMDKGVFDRTKLEPAITKYYVPRVIASYDKQFGSGSMQMDKVTKQSLGKSLTDTIIADASDHIRNRTPKAKDVSS